MLNNINNTIRNGHTNDNDKREKRTQTNTQKKIQPKITEKEMHYKNNRSSRHEMIYLPLLVSQSVAVI